MPKKSPAKARHGGKSTKSAQHEPSSRTASACTLIILVDNEPIRKAALAKYRQLEKETSLAQKQLEKHESQEIPAYEKWEAQHFGALLTEIRELRAELEKQAHLLEAIEEESYWSHIDMVSAYMIVMERVAAGKSPDAHDEADDDEDWEADDDWEEPSSQNAESAEDSFPPLPEDFDLEGFQKLSRSQQQSVIQNYRRVAEVYEMMTGRKAPSWEQQIGRFKRDRGMGKDDAPPRDHDDSQHSHRHPHEEAHPLSHKLKTLYRKLVRMLHPDTNPDLTPAQLELWHAAQQAYQNGDSDRLEAILARVELAAGVTTESFPVNTIQRMTQELKHALKGVKAMLRRARKSPAWQFNSIVGTPALARMEEQRHQLLQRTKMGVRAKIKVINEDLQELEEQAAAREAARLRAKKRAEKAEKKSPPPKAPPAKSPSSRQKPGSKTHRPPENQPDLFDLF